MTDRIEAAPEFDATLAEFDRRLREIQADLMADGDHAGAPPVVQASPPPRAAPEPPPPPEPPIPPPAPPVVPEPLPRTPPPEPPGPHGRSGPLADLLAQLRAPSSDLQTELREIKAVLSTLQEAVAAIEAMLAGITTDREPETPAGSDQATLSAGPFTRIDSVREFERELSSLRGVRGASVRGYEGAARAIIDVDLGEDH